MPVYPDPHWGLRVTECFGAAAGLVIVLTRKLKMVEAATLFYC